MYHVAVRHKSFDQPLNVGVIVKRHQRTGKQAYVYLFSTDRILAWDVLRNDYQLRFQIEFVFRDAKQYWGLEGFMVIKEAAVNGDEPGVSDGQPESSALAGASSARAKRWRAGSESPLPRALLCPRSDTIASEKTRAGFIAPDPHAAYRPWAYPSGSC
ncbi:MAG: hypothetical protein MUD01_05025 [Chloroflexaceae bacterium]|nr:hypothetical protein [Chloroflexaceae bacterium]